MTALAFASVLLRRTLRDRTSVFFMVLLPVLIILIIGTMVQNAGGLRVGLIGTPQGVLATSLATDLEDVGPVRTFADDVSARTALRRGEIEALVLIPADLDQRLLAGSKVDVPVLAGGAETSQAATRAAVAAAVGRHAERVQAAAFAAQIAGGDLLNQLPRATVLQDASPRIAVRTENVSTGSDFLPTGFGYSAPTMLVLFVFINSLAGGAALIQTRRLGIHARALAAPIRTRDLVVGELLGYLVLALVQSALIIAIGSLLFGVSWGNPLAAGALVLIWALVGTGAGVLSGSVFRTPEQAAAIGPAIGIGFAMLGGCMWPLEIVPPLVRAAGHVTPHAWVMDGWITVLSRNGGLTDILTQLLVLAAFATALVTTATWRLRARLLS